MRDPRLTGTVGYVEDGTGLQSAACGMDAPERGQTGYQEAKAALVVIFSLPFLLYRAVTEDRILQVELAGYPDYAARVRWRLVPGIW